MSEYIIAHCVDSVSGVRYDERREEIVRCRDCRWLLEDERYSEAACRFFCRTLPKEDYQDGFCKWGELK